MEKEEYGGERVRDAESAEAQREVVFPLGEHVVVEELAEDEVSVLRCIRCGAASTLTGAENLKSRRCMPHQPGGTAGGDAG
ncbi:MAG: hypothetical protein QXM16_09175 [Nitrososphaerota archaeon]